MTKKEMELEYKAKINNLNGKIEQIVMCLTQCLSIEEAKKRDYIVRTNYIGKLTHKQLKVDLKHEIAEKLKDTFESITNKILNYEFVDKENRINLLDEFYKILKDYEMKQIVIDTYGTKECK